ncbi:unnamed protein product [Closterium sp. NIES-53]
MPGSGGKHRPRQLSPARDLRGLQELLAPRVRQAAKAALGTVVTPTLLSSAVASAGNVGAGTKGPTARTLRVPLTELLRGGDVARTLLLLLALTASSAAPLRNSTPTTSATPASASTAATSATSATTATAAATPAPAAANSTPTSAAASTATPTAESVSLECRARESPVKDQRTPREAEIASGSRQG